MEAAGINLSHCYVENELESVREGSGREPLRRTRSKELMMS